VAESMLGRARSGDEEAFRQLVDPHRRELQLHCYRILGSLQDAEDLLQETLLAAWRGLPGLQQPESLRAWLYRIATNRCMNALRDAARRRPPCPPDAPFEPPAPTRSGGPSWLEPYPEVLLEGVVDASPGPEARYEAREAIELAFIVGLRRLPPRQRAVLVLRDVLGFHTAEVAEMLESSQASVKAALQRGRATLDEGAARAQRERAPAPGSAREREVARRFAEAFEADDIDGVVSLLTDDAWLRMPPATLEYQGARAIASFLRASATWRAGQRFSLVPARANTQPAFGLYLSETQTPIARAAGVIVLTLEGNRISAITRFLDQSIQLRFQTSAPSPSRRRERAMEGEGDLS
jgi:RNA polymerase sigma-70 factor (TIGR02960 family)